MKYFLTALFLTVLITGTQAQPAAPEIALQDVNGKVVRLSDLKGKLVLIDFWASWCGPCRKTMPELVSLYKTYQSQGLEIYGISIDESKAAWKKAIAADHITWIQVNEPGGWDAPTATAWKIDRIPSSFLIDPQGRILAADPTKAMIIAALKKVHP